MRTQIAIAIPITNNTEPSTTKSNQETQPAILHRVSLFRALYRADTEIQYPFLFLNYTFNLSSPQDRTTSRLCQGQLQERKPEQWKEIEGYTSVHQTISVDGGTWLTNTTITLVVNNVMDLEPPSVAAAAGTVMTKPRQTSRAVLRTWRSQSASKLRHSDR